MDNFDDYYNRFVANTYGVNVLSYLFFLAVFFILILFGTVFILLKGTKTAATIRNVDINADNNGFIQSRKH